MITKPKFKKKNQTETGSNRPVSVRFGFLGQKPVWLGFFSLTLFWLGFFPIWLGFFPVFFGFGSIFSVLNL
jgi:hypothetical protein